MNELIGFEYNAKNKKISEVDSLWAGELFVYYRNNEYRLCVKLGSDFTTETKARRFFINAYDILEEKFYNLYGHDEVLKFYGKIRIKGENVYRGFSHANDGRPDGSFSSAKNLLAQNDVSATPKIIHIKLPNEIERDAGIDPAYKANSKYNVLTFYHDACYFNTEYISDENWETITHESKAPIENNCEVEIEINGGLNDVILGVDWADVPF